MRIWTAVAVILLAAGCSSEATPAGDETVTITIPASWLSRMEKGADALLVVQVPDQPARKDVYVAVAEGAGDEGSDFAIVPMGTKAVVLDDTQPDQPQGKRKVRVEVAEGKYKGTQGEVLRLWLRPAK